MYGGTQNTSVPDPKPNKTIYPFRKPTKWLILDHLKPLRTQVIHQTVSWRVYQIVDHHDLPSIGFAKGWLNRWSPSLIVDVLAKGVWGRGLVLWMVVGVCNDETGGWQPVEWSIGLLKEWLNSSSSSTVVYGFGDALGGRLFIVINRRLCYQINVGMMGDPAKHVGTLSKGSFSEWW